jgi:hypothetical protein
LRIIRRRIPRIRIDRELDGVCHLRHPSHASEPEHGGRRVAMQAAPRDPLPNQDGAAA